MRTACPEPGSLACFDPLDGQDVLTLTAATGLHCTVQRRLRRLAADGLVAELEGRYYLVSALTGPVRLHPDEKLLNDSAEERGTRGRGHARRRRHQVERTAYHRWLAEQLPDRARRPRLLLVPSGVVDPSSGEVLDDRWRDWDLSDVRRPSFPYTPRQQAG
ncbi:hypothetical protein AB0N77_20480 [Streptomyces misionensis]|uniref:hypothetical protein n=1 Tax=Streptomyces misionensis TaxID=67331 RepID=UPI00342E2304